MYRVELFGEHNIAICKPLCILKFDFDILNFRLKL